MRGPTVHASGAAPRQEGLRMGEHHHGSSTVGRPGEATPASARPASRTTVIDRTTAPGPERLDLPSSGTRQTVVDGVTFIHQRFRDATPAGPPAALLQHFPTETGTWDPTAPPRTTLGRELILVEHLDPAAELDTDVPDLHGLARESLDFIDVLGLAEADLLGFSLGVRPTDDVVVLLSPRLVQRLVSTSNRARSTHR